MRYKIHSSYGGSGGHHAMHQLCYMLDAVGEDASMVYPPEPEPLDINPLYKKRYELNKFENRNNLFDEPDIIQVLPANWGAAYLKFDKATKNCLNLKGSSQFKSKKVFWWLGVGGWQNWDVGGFETEIDLAHPNLKKAWHGCQSRTAYDFLVASGEIPLSQIFMLYDFTTDEYIVKNDSVLHQTFMYRENIVLYNGAKSRELTQKIIDSCTDLNCKFIKLEGMTTEQIRDLALKSKVYIDFGQHGGRDRLPREMASCGCIVLSGSDGAAFNTVDVPVGYRKFRRKYDGEYDLVAIKNAIEHDLKFFHESFFDPHLIKYREKIRNEKQEAILSVKNMVSILNSAK